MEKEHVINIKRLLSVSSLLVQDASQIKRIVSYIILVILLWLYYY